MTHPIVKKVIEVAHKGLEPIELDEYAIEQIDDFLKKSIGKPDLADAVLDLINLAYYLDKNGSHTASMKLLNLIETIKDDINDLLDNDKTNS